MTDAIVVALIAATPPTILAAVSVVLAFKNHTKMDQVKVEINGRMTQLLQKTAEVGEAVGAKREHDRIDRIHGTQDE